MAPLSVDGMEKKKRITGTCLTKINKSKETETGQIGLVGHFMLEDYTIKKKRTEKL